MYEVPELNKELDIEQIVLDSLETVQNQGAILGYQKSESKMGGIVVYINKSRYCFLDIAKLEDRLKDKPPELSHYNYLRTVISNYLVEKIVG